MMTQKFTVGLVQHRCSPVPDENVAKAVAGIREAARRGAQIVCLQELFRTPYFCQREDHAFFDLAEPIPGPTSETLSKIAKETGVVVVASLFERRTAGVYHNSAAILDADGSLRGLYRKMHIPDDPLYYEKFYFTPGDLGFRAYDTKFGRVGTLVCWDQWYPEGARLTALGGADGHEREPGSSPDEGIEFWGGSFVCDPFGVVLKEASRTDEEVLVVECDRRHMETVRRHWPFLRDRRIDAYGAITKRFLDE
jgi:N-carbamoylputrescine amidase